MSLESSFSFLGEAGGITLEPNCLNSRADPSAIQLGLNVTWSILFFGLHMPGVAFGEIVALWFAILATTIVFWRSTPIAGYLLLPYLIWVAFATGLNFALWRMNA